MRDTDIDRIISHADASIRHWEARKPVQTCDGFSGIVRICDDEQFREAGIVRARVPEPAVPKPSATNGKDTSMSAGTSTSSSKPQEFNQSPTDTADETTCLEPDNQSLPQDPPPQRSQYDPVAAALAAAQAAVSAAEAAASAAQAAHWAQLSAQHKAAPAAPQAAPPCSLPPSTSASKSPSSQPPPPPPSPGAITGQGVQHQLQAQPPHHVLQPQHQQPPPPQPPPSVCAQPPPQPPQPPPWSLHTVPDMDCTWDDEPVVAAGTDWISQYVLAGGGEEAAAVKCLPATHHSEAAEAPEAAPQQPSPASSAPLSSLDIDERELKLDLELLGDLERTLGNVPGGEGGKVGVDVTFTEAATRGGNLPLSDLEGRGDGVGGCTGSASGVGAGASSGGGGSGRGDASSSEEVGSEEAEGIVKFYALGIDSSSEGGDGGGGDLASEGSGEDESDDKEEEEEDAEEEDNADGEEGGGNDGGSSSNGGGGVPLPDVPTQQHSKPASISTATSRTGDAAVVTPVDVSEQQPAPHGGTSPGGGAQQQSPTHTPGAPPHKTPPAQSSPAAPPPPPPPHTAMPAATAAAAAGAAVDTTTEATAAASQAAKSEGRTEEGVKATTSPPNLHHPPGPSALSHPARKAGPPPPQHPPLTKAQLLAKVQRQIVSAAVRQARVEEHEQLLWVDDLPQAPSSQVPPRAPRNE